jgi:hypothetical protein
MVAIIFHGIESQFLEKDTTTRKKYFKEISVVFSGV